MTHQGTSQICWGQLGGHYNSYVDGRLSFTYCDWKELGFGVIGAETLLTDPGHDSIDILLEVFYIIIIIDNLRALHSYPCDSYRQV